MKTRLRTGFWLFALAGGAWAQDGGAIYRTRCAGCHEAASGRIPPVSVLRAMPAAAILDVLENGVMKAQAAELTVAEKKAAADYLGIPAGVETKGTANACAVSSLLVRRSTVGPGWSRWGVDLENSRFQTAESAGLIARQVPQLTLKWSFNLGADAEPRSQPAVVGGTVYVGAGKLYALNVKTGCTEWVFAGDAPVRSGLTVGAAPGLEPAVIFGDSKANVYAVSTSAGKLLWKTHVDQNFAAMVTGTPVLYKGIVYVGVSSFEEVMAASPKYPCCSFRGNVVALNASTGAQVWKTYTIDASPQAVGDTMFHGPSGAGIWSSPTVDEKLQRLYVATGDNYSGPATSTSDAVMAMDLASGRVLWTRQATTGDIYNVGCDPGVHGACPEVHGHDFDFGQPPILVSLENGKRALVIGQKSGVVYGLDPDEGGKPMWARRIGEGGTLGGIQWGSAAWRGRVYVALSDLRLKGVPDKSEPMGYRLEADGAKGGGLFAIEASTGRIVWSAKPTPCGERRRCSPAQSAAVSGIPGVVFSGSLDGHIRAYATDTGSVTWDADTEQDYKTVGGEVARGGSLDVCGATIAAGTLFVMSGYGRYGGRPGNVLLAYSMGGR